eukprot:scaffold1883_cov261-Pinguiococcus_pyrenoidosus.AAC.39
MRREREDRETSSHRSKLFSSVLVQRQCRVCEATLQRHLRRSFLPPLPTRPFVALTPETLAETIFSRSLALLYYQWLCSKAVALKLRLLALLLTSCELVGTRTAERLQTRVEANQASKLLQPAPQPVRQRLCGLLKRAGPSRANGVRVAPRAL